MRATEVTTILLPEITQNIEDDGVTINIRWGSTQVGVMIVILAGDDEAVWAFADDTHSWSETGKEFSLKNGIPCECVAKIFSLGGLK